MTPKPTPSPQRSSSGTSAKGGARPDRAGGLQARVDALEAELRAGGTQLVDPKSIRSSRFYNRFELDLDPADPSFDALLQSVQSQRGNAIPVLLTRQHGEDRYEVVYGHRRVAACRAAGVPVLAFVREGLESKEIGRLRVLENSERSDPSIIDRARQILSLIDDKVFDSQNELADAIGITPPYVSMLLSIAKVIPVTLQMAHPDHHRISYRQAKAIAEVGKRDASELKRRIEWVRRNKSTLSAAMATEHLLRGTAQEPDQTSVAWTSTKTSATLKVRGLRPGQSKKLNAGIESLLQELGLIPETG